MINSKWCVKVLEILRKTTTSYQDNYKSVLESNRLRGALTPCQPRCRLVFRRWSANTSAWTPDVLTRPPSRPPLPLSLSQTEIQVKFKVKVTSRPTISRSVSPGFEISGDSQSGQSQSHVMTDDQSVSKSWIRAPSGSRDRTLISVWYLLFYRCRAPPMTRGRVCHL
jgi:hypothetical protein